MSLTFYYAPMSTASVTELVLEELGIPCEKVKLDLQAGGTKTSDFLRINPNAKVPVIVHDGVAIWESSAITMYLGETFGVDKKLWPAPGPKRGEAMRWVAWTGVSLVQAVYRWLQNTSDRIPADERNAKAGAAGKAEVENLLRIADLALEGNDYLTGAAFTLADSHLSSFCEWMGYLGFDFTPYKHLSAWRERCAKRPATARLRAAMSG